MYVDSPFPVENRCLLIGSQVSSRYKRRGPEEYQKIASYIYQMIAPRKGNYMAFFPSYRLMNDVCEYFQERIAGTDTEVLLQTPSMGEQERENFLQAFSGETDHTLVGFCVMGGIFLRGSILTGKNSSARRSSEQGFRRWEPSGNF